MAPNDPNDPNDSIPTDPPRPPPEERCGSRSERGNICNLRKGHQHADLGGLHAGGGELWEGPQEPLPGDDGWRPPSVREVSVELTGDEEARLGRQAVADIRRCAEAAERQANALEGIRELFDHYIQETLHTVRS